MDKITFNNGDVLDASQLNAIQTNVETALTQKAAIDGTSFTGSIDAPTMTTNNLYISASGSANFLGNATFSGSSITVSASETVFNGAIYRTTVVSTGTGTLEPYQIVNRKYVDDQIEALRQELSPASSVAATPSKAKKSSKTE